MKGKIAVVTGANSGIGKVTALELAQKGASVVMVCRNRQKGETAMKAIIAETGNTNIDLLFCDFASQRQIRVLAKEIKYRYDKVDVLVNNAGLMMKKRVLTEDGLETTFAVNHLGYFLLSNLLLPLLKPAPAARIVNVASEAHRYAKVDFDNLQAEKKFSSWGSYGQSKLANILFTYELSHRLRGTNIVANCLHPGIVRTNFGKDGNFLWRAAIKLAGGLFITPEKGAETSIYLATATELTGITGKYFSKKKIQKSNKQSYDVGVARKLWAISEQLTRLKEF